MEKEQASVSHFNQSVLLKIDKSITAAQLQSALEQLMSRHDALRLSFEKQDNQWQTKLYHQRLAVRRSMILKSSTKADLSKAITARAAHYQQSLDIQAGPLLRMALMETPQSEETNRLLMVIHHLAVDGVSWRILPEDLEELLSLR